MKRLFLFLLVVAFAVCVSREHIPQTPARTTLAASSPTPLTNSEMLDQIMALVEYEHPVSLENGEWGYLKSDGDSHYVFVWRGNFLLSEMRVRRIIGAWIAFEEKEECDLGIRFGPAWSSEGKPSPDISQSTFGLYIRVGDEEVFFKMLRIQPPHLQDC